MKKEDQFYEIALNEILSKNVRKAAFARGPFFRGKLRRATGEKVRFYFTRPIYREQFLVKAVRLFASGLKMGELREDIFAPRQS